MCACVLNETRGGGRCHHAAVRLCCAVVVQHVATARLREERRWRILAALGYLVLQCVYMCVFYPVVASGRSSSDFVAVYSLVLSGSIGVLMLVVSAGVGVLVLF